MAATLMVQGTASSAGKSLLVTALCRWFRRRGVRVAPFKAQNMALNAGVTPEGLEMGRAQIVQAEACGIAPHVDMNPVLLKPEGQRRSQLVLLGRTAGHVEAGAFNQKKAALRDAVASSLHRLRSEYELVIIEGAGSPAEVNLRAGDIVNMHVARLVQAPVLLVGDIDRGGVLAALVGTLELLPPEERALIAGLVINKFRGDLDLLRPALDFLSERTGKPVVGVLPHLHDLALAEEDSTGLERRGLGERELERRELEARRAPGAGRPSATDAALPANMPRTLAAGSTAGVVAIVRLPHLSNYDEFLPLELEPQLSVRYISKPEEVAGAELLILPGSKHTLNDLEWLHKTGFTAALRAHVRDGGHLLGICGGCQMLGELIDDPGGVETPGGAQREGLGLLALRTVFQAEKRTVLVERRLAAHGWLGEAGDVVRGYLMHMGRLQCTGEAAGAVTALTTAEEGAQAIEGARSADGRVYGTMLHGLFENDAVRSALLRRLGREPSRLQWSGRKEREYERLADAVEENLDTALLERLVRQQVRK